MSYVLTYWEDARIKNDPADYDEIETIHIKSVDEIQILLINKPKRCKFITLERTGPHIGRDGSKTEKYRIKPLWEKNNPLVQDYRKYYNRELI